MTIKVFLQKIHEGIFQSEEKDKQKQKAIGEKKRKQYRTIRQKNSSRATLNQ